MIFNNIFQLRPSEIWVTSHWPSFYWFVERSSWFILINLIGFIYLDLLSEARVILVVLSRDKHCWCLYEAIIRLSSFWYVFLRLFESALDASSVCLLASVELVFKVTIIQLWLISLVNRKALAHREFYNCRIILESHYLNKLKWPYCVPSNTISLIKIFINKHSSRSLRFRKKILCFLDFSISLNFLFALIVVGIYPNMPFETVWWNFQLHFSSIQGLYFIRWFSTLIGNCQIKHYIANYANINLNDSDFSCSFNYVLLYC